MRLWIFDSVKLVNIVLCHRLPCFLKLYLAGYSSNHNCKVKVKIKVNVKVEIWVSVGMEVEVEAIATKNQTPKRENPLTTATEAGRRTRTKERTKRVTFVPTPAGP